jgi:hypothetical protein
MTEYTDHPWRAWNRPSGHYAVSFPHKDSPQSVGFWSQSFRHWQIEYQGVVAEHLIARIGPPMNEEVK